MTMLFTLKSNTFYRDTYAFGQGWCRLRFRPNGLTKNYFLRYWWMAPDRTTVCGIALNTCLHFVWHVYFSLFFSQLKTSMFSCHEYSVLDVLMSCMIFRCYIELIRVSSVRFNHDRWWWFYQSEKSALSFLVRFPTGNGIRTLQSKT